MRAASVVAVIATATAACALLATAPGAAAGAAGPTWKMKQQHFASISASIDCDSPTNCVAPIVNTEVGTEFLFSQDQGNTWQAVPDTIEMMLLAGAIAGNTVAAASPFNVISGSKDAQGNWSFVLQPDGYPWVQSQNVEPFGGTWFGAVGGAELSTASSWGTALSSDSGKTWWFSNASHVITCWTRYGAYPTTSTYYISGGNWPETAHERAFRTSEAATHYHLSQRIKLNRGRGGTKPRAEYTFAANRSAADATASTVYLAQILKTTDGGKSWTSQFESSGLFYFNQIGCGSATHCCAVGEADTDSKEPGVQIWCTFDGQTWARQYYGSDPTFSALSLQFLTPDHIFVGGASLRQQLIEGIFWESLDGGKTWTESFVKDAYPAELTFGSETMGLAVGFDLEGDSCLLAYN